MLQLSHAPQPFVNVEGEQEAAWVCQATGQESQDKGKETQMEVLGLKPSHIPKTQKTNIHQQGLERFFNENHLYERRDWLSASALQFIEITSRCCHVKVLLLRSGAFLCC